MKQNEKNNRKKNVIQLFVSFITRSTSFKRSGNNRVLGGSVHPEVWIVLLNSHVDFSENATLFAMFKQGFTKSNRNSNCQISPGLKRI